jgi:hypothetical protein
MKTIFRQANVTTRNYAYLESSTGTLHLCENNTESARPTECPVIWPLPGAKPTIVNGKKVARRSLGITKTLTDSGKLTGLKIFGVPPH